MDLGSGGGAVYVGGPFPGVSLPEMTIHNSPWSHSLSQTCTL